MCQAEKELLEAYRQLDNDKQAAVIEFAKTLLEPVRAFDDALDDFLREMGYIE
jgi:hypothetical protein